MKTETLLFALLAVLAGAYVFGQMQRPTAAPAQPAAAPDDDINPGGVMVSPGLVEWADQFGATDTTGDPELDALVNGYAYDDSGAVGL